MNHYISQYTCPKLRPGFGFGYRSVYGDFGFPYLNSAKSMVNYAKI
jgi:hypothetical protein